LGRILTYIQEAKSEQIIEYVTTCQKELSKNVNLEESYKKLTTMVNAIEK